ncbi:efflux RND transporter permease subunit [Desulfococcaceae bacterium OttesenSCG-928-F15]|nr:efflux RND transporter permease subunit [Desulfococcaceae bacterium OttesenSCG-928-F15]
MQNKSSFNRGSIAWMARNHVAANLIMLVMLLGGFILFTTIKQEVYPEYSMGRVTVSVSYPGAGPAEVEQGIILALEEAVQGLEGVDKILSTASEGLGSIRIETIEGTDINRFSQNVQREVDRISTFPEGAENPRILVDSRMREAMAIAVYGPQAEYVLREAAERLRDRLLQEEGITQVALTGVRDYEISVWISQEVLRRYGLTLEEVAARLAAASIEMGGGRLDTQGGEVLLRMKERRYAAADYRNTAILTRTDGSRLLLGDIARVEEGFEDSDNRAFFNGYPSVMVSLYRIGHETPTSVSKAARKALAAYSQNLPQGISVDVVRDSSRSFQERADLLLRNALYGLIIVFCLLALFLELRLAFWVTFGIPVSFLGAFLVLSMLDFSINMISMFAFIITLGIVVDDAIVVGENIYSKRQKGWGFLDASIFGAREMATPVVFSVLTNVVAFIPIFFVPGSLGKTFRELPIVVTAVFLVSLLESLYILPAHLGYQREKSWIFDKIASFQGRFAALFTRFVDGVYAPLVRKSIRYRYLVLSIACAVLFITFGYMQSGRMGLELFPRIEADYAYCEATLPFGSSKERATSVHNRLVASARKLVANGGGKDLSLGIFSQIRQNVVSVRVYLTPPDVRPVATSDFVAGWREDVGPVAGLENISFESDRGGPGSGKALTIEISHRDIPTLETAARHLAAELSSFPLVSDVDNGAAHGKRQVDIVMRPEGERMGLTSREVAKQIRASFQGVEALRFQRGRNEVTVRVRLPDAERLRLEHLEDLVIRTPDGVEVLLRDVVRLESGRAYTKIQRRGGRRILTITANITPSWRAGEVVTALENNVFPDLLAQYPGLTASFEGRQADMRDSTTRLIQGLFLAMLAVYALLAIPFKSYFQPLIIMGCIPFGVIGAVFGHLLMGYSLSMMSLFGIVALCGVVVNGSLVLIDLANRFRLGGAGVIESIENSSLSRFRPIILTTLTTFGGLAPMIFETSRQARFLIPMAISLGFGILFASLITLIVVPAFYVMVEDIHFFFRKESEAEAERNGPDP